jgi:hypothetical protein
MVSPEKQRVRDQQVAYFLGTVKRKFEKGELAEDYVYNFDETHHHRYAFWKDSLAKRQKRLQSHGCC